MLLYINVFLYDKIITLILNTSLFNLAMLCKENIEDKVFIYKFYCKKVLLLLLKNIIFLK